MVPCRCRGVLLYHAECAGFVKMEISASGIFRGIRIASAIRPVRAAAFFSTGWAGSTNCVSVFVPNGRGVFCLYQAGELRSAERGRLPRPRLGQRGRDTCGFPSSLNSYLSLGDSTAKIGEAGPLRNRGTAVGLPLRVFLRLFAVHRQRTATQTVESTQARHKVNCPKGKRGSPGG